MRTKTEVIPVHAPSLESSALDEWANEFYKAKKAENLSAETLRVYQQALGYFLNYCHAQLIDQVTQISSGEIRNYLLWLEEENHNSGGIHLAYRVLKTFLRWYELEAEPEGWKNPIRKVKAPKLSEEPLDPVEIDTVMKMIAVCDRSFLGIRNKAILLFLLDSGLRARELLSLQIKNVNQVTREVQLLRGKGRKPRTVFIGRESRKALRAYLKIRNDQIPDLWITTYKTPLHYAGLRLILEDTAKLAGVPAPSAHDFRRAFAINMLRKGVDLLTLAALMGHTSLKVLRRYLKYLPDDLREAHEKGSPVDHLKD